MTSALVLLNTLAIGTLLIMNAQPPSAGTTQATTSPFQHAPTTRLAVTTAPFSGQPGFVEDRSQSQSVVPRNERWVF